MSIMPEANHETIGRGRGDFRHPKFISQIKNL